MPILQRHCQHLNGLPKLSNFSDLLGTHGFQPDIAILSLKYIYIQLRGYLWFCYCYAVCGPASPLLPDVLLLVHLCLVYCLRLKKFTEICRSSPLKEQCHKIVCLGNFFFIEPVWSLNIFICVKFVKVCKIIYCYILHCTVSLNQKDL